jgi:hypothetical protein
MDGHVLAEAVLMGTCARTPARPQDPTGGSRGRC